MGKQTEGSQSRLESERKWKTQLVLTVSHVSRGRRQSTRHARDAAGRLQVQHTAQLTMLPRRAFIGNEIRGLIRGRPKGAAIRCAPLCHVRGRDQVHAGPAGVVGRSRHHWTAVPRISVLRLRRDLRRGGWTRIAAARASLSVGSTIPWPLTATQLRLAICTLR